MPQPRGNPQSQHNADTEITYFPTTSVRLGVVWVTLGTCSAPVAARWLFMTKTTRRREELCTFLDSYTQNPIDTENVTINFEKQPKAQEKKKIILKILSKIKLWKINISWWKMCFVFLWLPRASFQCRCYWWLGQKSNVAANFTRKKQTSRHASKEKGGQLCQPHKLKEGSTKSDQKNILED